MSAASDETKTLWKEIYENALSDRVNAYMLFTDLCQHVMDNQQGHLNHGKLLTTYLERMNKANDQLLKLAELIERAIQKEAEIDSEALFSEFEK